MPSETLIPAAEPWLEGNEWKYVKECLDSGWLSSAGSFVTRFENEFAAYSGAKHAVAVSNGTVGLHAALRVLGVERDDEVLVSDLTFIASVNAITYCGAHPILMDVSLEDWQIDTDLLEDFLSRECELRNGACCNRKTGRRVRAIVPVHILGLSCKIDRIVDIARRYNLFVIEDAAEGAGVRYRGQHVGTFGDIGVFSFNGNKLVTSGGGGMLTTNDTRVADYARYLTNQAKDDAIEYVHNEIGFNYRLTNIQAAVGLAQLECIDRFIEKKRVLSRRYTEAFTSMEGISLMPLPPNVTPTYWLFTVLLPETTTLAQRQYLIQRLNEQKIGARPLWRPAHTLPPYRVCQVVGTGQSVRLYSRAVSLPSSVGLTEPDQSRCIAALQAGVSGLAVMPNASLTGNGRKDD